MDFLPVLLLCLIGGVAFTAFFCADLWEKKEPKLNKIKEDKSNSFEKLSQELFSLTKKLKNYGVEFYQVKKVNEKFPGLFIGLEGYDSEKTFLSYSVLVKKEIFHINLSESHFYLMSASGENYSCRLENLSTQKYLFEVFSFIKEIIFYMKEEIDKIEKMNTEEYKTKELARDALEKAVLAVKGEKNTESSKIKELLEKVVREKGVLEKVKEVV